MSLRSLPIQTKIRELQRHQQQEAETMMGSGGNPLNYTAAYQQMLSLAGYTAVQQAAMNQGRNPYTQAAAFPGLLIIFVCTRGTVQVLD